MQPLKTMQSSSLAKHFPVEEEKMLQKIAQGCTPAANNANYVLRIRASKKSR